MPQKLIGPLLREYNKLGCAPTLVLLASVVPGGLLVGNLAGVLIICLQFGSKAYFQEHLRFVPHRELLLTNGAAILPQYHVLYFVFDAVGLMIWIAVFLLLSIALNHLLDRINARRWRARRLKWRKGTTYFKTRR